MLVFLFSLKLLSAFIFSITLLSLHTYSIIGFESIRRWRKLCNTVTLWFLLWKKGLVFDRQSRSCNRLIWSVLKDCSGFVYYFLGEKERVLELILFQISLLCLRVWYICLLDNFIFIFSLNFNSASPLATFLTSSNVFNLSSTINLSLVNLLNNSFSLALN